MMCEYCGSTSLTNGNCDYCETKAPKQSRLRRLVNFLLYSYISLRTTTVVAILLFTVCASAAVGYYLAYSYLYQFTWIP
jgi:hypothetical protein